MRQEAKKKFGSPSKYVSCLSKWHYQNETDVPNSSHVATVWHWGVMIRDAAKEGWRIGCQITHHLIEWMINLCAVVTLSSPTGKIYIFLIRVSLKWKVHIKCVLGTRRSSIKDLIPSYRSLFEPEIVQKVHNKSNDKVWLRIWYLLFTNVHFFATWL